MTDSCKHHWSIDASNIGTCRFCGEVRRFPFDDKGVPEILKHGRPPMSEKSNKEYLDLPKSRKREIATDAHQRGCVVVSKETGIPVGTIRAWCGRLLNGIGKEPQPTVCTVDTVDAPIQAETPALRDVIVSALIEVIRSLPAGGTPLTSYRRETLTGFLEECMDILYPNPDRE